MKANDMHRLSKAFFSSRILSAALGLILTFASFQLVAAQDSQNPLQDYPGTSLNGLRTAEVQLTLEKCRRLCTDRTGCAGFDYSSSTQQCRLFGGIASARDDSGYTAGTRYPIPGFRSPVAVTEPDAETSPRTFRHYANYDIFGFDLAQGPATSMSQCEDLCRDNPECKAFTFNEWNQKCFLKSGTAELRLEPRARTGVATDASQPGYRDAQVAMEYYRGYTITGSQTGNARVANNRDQCESMCWSNEQCIAFSFLRGQQECRMFDHATNRFPKNGVESGAKIQPRP